MDRFDFFFRQKVTEQELDDAFDAAERAITNFVGDFKYIGVAVNGDVVEHAPQNFTVDVQGPAVIYDQTAARIAFSTTQNPSLTLDELGAATAVAGGGNEKYLSLFAEFTRNLTDPRTDGFGNPIFFNQAESFKLNVVQGVEAGAGTAVRPPLRPDQILLADVLIVFGQTTILNSDIFTDRTEVVFDLTGSPLSIRTKDLATALQDMVDEINTLVAASGTLAGNNVWTGTNEYQDRVILNRSSSDDPGIETLIGTGAETVLLYEGVLGAGDGLVRIYARQTNEPLVLEPGLLITYAAKWRNGTSDWERDGVVAKSLMLAIDRQGDFVFAERTGGAATWSTSAWFATRFARIRGGSVQAQAFDGSTVAQHEDPAFFNTAVPVNTGQYTLVHQFYDPGGTGDSVVRLYASRQKTTAPKTVSGMMMTFNARWQSATNDWTQDNAGFDSFAYRLSRYGHVFEEKALGSGDWADDAWDAGRGPGFAADAPHGALVTHDRAINLAKGVGTRSNEGWEHSFGLWRTVLAGAPASEVHFAIELPLGATNVELRIRANPGAARGTVGDRMRFRVQHAARNFGSLLADTFTDYADVRDDGTGAAQFIDLLPSGGGMPDPAEDSEIRLIITGGNDSEVNVDSFDGLKIQYDINHIPPGWVM